MTQIVLNTVQVIIGILVTSSTGYLANKCKNYKEKLKIKEENETMQNLAIKIILKSQLTKTFFVYNEMKQIPDYVYQDFQDMLQVYESFGGNGYVHNLARRMETWDIIETGILKEK